MQSFRAITLRCTSPVAHGTLENVMQQCSFDFCASLGFKRHHFASLSEENQPWFHSSDCSNGVYAGVDHTALLPLDEEIIESMRDCEALFMYMMIRKEYARNISYARRKNLYLLHLRFWNDFLIKNNINVFFSSILPHEMPDHIIYCLCKLKGIPTIFNHATPMWDTAFLQDDIEQSAIQIKERLDELNIENSECVLSDELEEYYIKQTQPIGEGAIIFPDKPRSRFSKFASRILLAPGALLHWIPTLFSAATWARRVSKVQSAWMQTRLRKQYDSLAVEPDYNQKYIYFPLQFQPECSTCPMAGAFVDQHISMHLLSQSIPNDVLIYVKEHPRQRKEGIAGRSLELYPELASMPNVRLMKHESNTFKLREDCCAVATGTGTAGLEALFREKPVLLFGHTFFQHAPGVFQIRTSTDCAKASKAIFEDGKKPKLPEVRRFLKAVEDTRMHASIAEWYLENMTKLSVEQSTQVFTDALVKRLKAL